MADKRTITGTQPIYDVARECAIMFEKYLQGPKDPVWEAVSVSRRRFRSWAAYLGVFSHESASLDMRLRLEPEVRDLVMLLLDVLWNDLHRVIEISSRGPIPQPSTLLPFSNAVKGALDGIVGSIDRLHRLGVRIRTLSRDDMKLEERIANFAKQLPKDNFRYAAWVILNYKFPKAEKGLIKKLTKSVVFRRNRLLYQRHHHKKLSRVRRSSISEAVAPPDSASMTKKTKLQKQHQDKTELTKQPKRWSESSSQSEYAAQTELVSRTNPTQFRRKSFNKEDKKGKRRAPTVFTAGSSWTNYPRPPEAEGMSKYAVCQFCFQELQVKDNDDPRWWEQHVDRDMDHYVCISDDCQRSLCYFSSFKSWLDHMDLEHEPDWPRSTYAKNSEWRCTLSEKHDYAFPDTDSLKSHIEISHSGELEPPELQLVVDNSKFPQLRELGTCPLCEEPINRLQPIPQEQESEIDNPRTSRVQFIRLAEHIAQHLKSVSFLSLWGIEPEEKQGQGESSQAIFLGSDRSALNDSIVFEGIDEDDVPNTSITELWDGVRKSLGGGGRTTYFPVPELRRAVFVDENDERGPSYDPRFEVYVEPGLWVLFSSRLSRMYSTIPKPLEQRLVESMFHRYATVLSCRNEWLQTERPWPTFGDNWERTRAGDPSRPLTGLDFLCPYCHRTVEGQVKSDSDRWRRHVATDFEPYVCLFESCETPSATYKSMESWVKHMHTHDRWQWCCKEDSHLDQYFHSASDFMKHVSVRHVGRNFDDDELQKLAECVRSPAEHLFSSCPICSADLGNIHGSIESHIAEHLVDIAIMSLPRTIGDSETDTDTESSASDRSYYSSKSHEPMLENENDSILPHLKSKYDDSDTPSTWGFMSQVTEQHQIPNEEGPKVLFIQCESSDDIHTD
ncbi:hypothetical protein GGR51DRAFT_543262 [Nemania sp. FL0031]|nr:hypothetical protein GGR51DRAFT_543262 [Nemania sp. FL0031]